MFNSEHHDLNGIVGELFPVIRDNGCWDAEPTYYVLPNKSQNVRASNDSEGFDFNPFGQVVDCDYQQLVSPRGHWEWAHHIDSPLSEGPWSLDWN